MEVLVIHGPNLNLLGTRQPEIYGSMTLSELEERVAEWGRVLGVDVGFFQSNSEGALIDAIQDSSGTDALVINPGALTHTSRSIGDAILSRAVPSVEVHISDIHAREPWRSHSLVAPACVRSIVGRGVVGYRDALRHLVNRSAMPFETVAYGPAPDHVADLRRPEGEPVGKVALVHGGFWLRQWERDGMESLAIDLSRRGYVTWNVEYRRLGTGGGWPGSAHDVETAVEHLITNIDGNDRVALIGHSAGGFLALWAGKRASLSKQTSTIGLAAVTDLALLAASNGPGADQARILLNSGAPPEVSADDRDSVIHGRDDELVPAAHSTRFEGVANLSIVDSLGHFDLLDPSRAHWETALASLQRPD